MSFNGIKTCLRMKTIINSLCRWFLMAGHNCILKRKLHLCTVYPDSSSCWLSWGNIWNQLCTNSFLSLCVCAVIFFKLCVYLFFWMLSLHQDALVTMCSEDINIWTLFVHSLYQDGSGRQCLLLERVMKSDAGWYTLSAINEAGMSTCNARLDVGSKSTSCVFVFLCKWALNGPSQLSSSHSSLGCKIKQQMENAVRSTLQWVQLSSLEHVKQMLICDRAETWWTYEASSCRPVS